MNRLQIKSNAKQQIKGKLLELFLISFILFFVGNAMTITTVSMSISDIVKSALINQKITNIQLPSYNVTTINVGGLILSILSWILSLSVAYIYLKIASNANIVFDDILLGFYDAWSAIKLYFCIGVFKFLWTLLFIIPGIVKGYAYSMAGFILAENKNMDAFEAIRCSQIMMQGHKWELFVLDLSFIGWMLLIPITFGIAGIYVIPYMNAAKANFYFSLKDSEPQAQII